MPAAIKPRLTLKQREFVKKSIESLNPVKAVRETYDLGSKGGSKTKAHLDNTAAVIASQNLKKPVIKRAFKNALKRLDEGAIIERLESFALDAGDKRSAIAAANLIFRVTGRFAPTRISLDRYQEELDEFRQEEEPEDKALDSGSYDEELKQVDSS